MGETTFNGDPVDVLAALRQQLFELRPARLDEPRYATLTAAARAGDVAAIATFLDQGADIEERTYGWRSPLAAACSAGSEAAVRLLLERGASPEPKLLRSPLIAAARGGSVAVVRLLLEAGVSLSWPSGAQAVVDAMNAGQPEVAALLVDLEPEIRDARAWLTQPGMSEFADSVDGNRFLPERVRQHAERRRQALSRSGRGRTRGRAVRGRGGRPALPAAERQHLMERICTRIASPELAGMFAGGDDAGPLLRIASKFGLAPVVSALLDAGCSPNARDTRSRNALHYVSSSRLGADALEVARRLVAAGIQVDAGDQDGLTPLMLAAAASDEDMVGLLLDAGADARRQAAGMSVARHAEGPSETAVVELLRCSAPERPAVVFAPPEEAAGATMGCRRWLDALPGGGMVWAVAGGLDPVAAAVAAALAARRIDHLERRPAAWISGGWFLMQVNGSRWTLLRPFGSESMRFPGASRRAEELSGTLGRELLTVHASDTAGSVLVRRLRGGKVVETAEWEIGGPCSRFRSELRDEPEWLRARTIKGRKKRVAPGPESFELYFAELALDVPVHGCDDDGLDTQLVLPETSRDQVAGVVCLARSAAFAP